MSKRWIHRLFLPAYPTSDRPTEKFCALGPIFSDFSFILAGPLRATWPFLGPRSKRPREQHRQLLRNVARTPYGRDLGKWNFDLGNFGLLHFRFWNFWIFSFYVVVFLVSLSLTEGMRPSC